MLWVSFVVAMVIALGKIAISLLSAFAIVYFRFPFRGLVFWAIFITLMLPVEVRIGPTYQVVADLGLLNTYAGLTVPLIASATATFLFRQFFLTVPDELVEAARIDGAGPMRFFKDILLPLSKTSIAALFVIQFIYGWNQYLWPLLATTSEDMYPVVLGIKRAIFGEIRRLEHGDGHRHPGHAAAGGGGDADAEVVRQGPGGYREINRQDMAAIQFNNVIKRYGSGPKANQVIHGVNAESTTASSSSSSALGLRQVHPAAHGGRAGGDHRRRDLDRRARGQRPGAAERDIAMVFQNYALYPHMSVFDNMAYGLKIAKVPASEIAPAWTRPPDPGAGRPAGPQAARAVGRPAPARGHGPRHRAPAAGVPVRRAAVQPGRQAARQTRLEIQKLHRELGITSLFVTHDQVEAMTLAQRMIVMNAGAWSSSARPKRSTTARPAPSWPASSARRP
jgi:ABC-type polar amino acid transport system ATPase subunit